MANKAKKAAPTVAKSMEAPVKARLPLKLSVKLVVEALVQEVVTPKVLTTTRSKREVQLPQRFVQ